MGLQALDRDVVGIEIEQALALLHASEVPVQDPHPVTPRVPWRRRTVWETFDPNLVESDMDVPLVSKETGEIEYVLPHLPEVAARPEAMWPVSG
jgi:hypothetical protein